METGIFQESFVGLLQLLYDIFSSLYDSAYGIITEMSRPIGDKLEELIPAGATWVIPDVFYDISIITFMFGAGITVFIVYQLFTWVLNIIT